MKPAKLKVKSRFLKSSTLQGVLFVALVSVDDDLPTVGELTNEELFAEAAVTRAAKRHKPENNNEGADDDDEEEEHISNAEVVTSLNKLRTFTQKQGMSATWVKEFFYNMEKEMMREITMKQKQTTIQDNLKLCDKSASTLYRHLGDTMCLSLL